MCINVCDSVISAANVRCTELVLVRSVAYKQSHFNALILFQSSSRRENRRQANNVKRDQCLDGDKVETNFKQIIILPVVPTTIFVAKHNRHAQEIEPKPDHADVIYEMVWSDRLGTLNMRGVRLLC